MCIGVVLCFVSDVKPAAVAPGGFRFVSFRLTVVFRFVSFRVDIPRGFAELQNKDGDYG